MTVDDETLVATFPVGPVQSGLDGDAFIVSGDFEGPTGTAFFAVGER